MTRILPNNISKLFNNLAIGGFVALLVGCGAMSGSSNQADGGGPQGMALDDIAQNGVGGIGSGGAMAGGGGLPGLDPRNPGGGGAFPPAGGGSSDPFSDVGGGGSSGHASGSGTECSGGVCAGDTPVGNLFGAIKISVKLHFSPENPTGDCNTLWPPKEEREVCGFGEYRTQPSGGGLFSNLWIREAQALPVGGRDIRTEPTKAVICGTETVQPPMDANLVPKVAVEAQRPFYSYSSETYKKTLVATCGADGKWLAETENIRVPFSPYPDGNNTWDFKIDALFPQEGVWVSRGTRDLKIKCSWDPHPTETRIKCEEQFVLPAVKGDTALPVMQLR